MALSLNRRFFRLLTAADVPSNLGKTSSFVSSADASLLVKSMLLDFNSGPAPTFRPSAGLGGTGSSSLLSSSLDHFEVLSIAPSDGNLVVIIKNTVVLPPAILVDPL